MCLINFQRFVPLISGFKLSQVVLNMSNLHLSRTYPISSAGSFKCFLLCSERSVITTSLAYFLAFTNSFIRFYRKNGKQCFCLPLGVDLLLALLINFTRFKYEVRNFGLIDPNQCIVFQFFFLYCRL